MVWYSHLFKNFPQSVMKGERRVSSINGVEESRCPQGKNEVRTLSYTYTKINAKWIEDLKK